MNTFDSIYVFDLHGSSKKLERSPDGTKDQNVFDIMQGVCISILVKSPRRDHKRGVYHRDLWGTRDSKNEALWSAALREPDFEEIQPTAPYYFFVPRDETGSEQYGQGFSVKDLFVQMGSGVKNERDGVCIQFDDAEIRKVVELFQTEPEDTIRQRLGLGKDSRDWTVAGAKKDTKSNVGRFMSVLYRPFDTRKTYYTGQSRGFSGTPGGQRMRQMTSPNVALLTCRQQSTFTFSHAMVTDSLSDICTLSSQTKETGYCGPLYLYPEEGTLETERRVNFDPKIYAEIRARAGLILPRSGEELEERPDELRVFDYIYGVLHSPYYRRTYAQFLKIDFPRIPYPASPEVFAHVAEKGGQLRRLHLMEDAAIGATPYPFKGDGDNVVVKPEFATNAVHPGPIQGFSSAAPEETGRGFDKLSPNGAGALGRVMINPDQYFENVPRTAWEFHIGGYQPAQKWLKDRKGRTLSFEDVMHYQKIIKILNETDRIMKEIVLPL